MPEKDLEILVKNMSPLLSAEEYVFCKVQKESFAAEFCQKESPEFLSSFLEADGISLILRKDLAQTKGLGFEGSFALISCQIKSDLQAVGFLALMTSALASAGIAANAISAFSHDHLLVPWQKRERAMQVLQELSEQSF